MEFQRCSHYPLESFYSAALLVGYYLELFLSYGWGIRYVRVWYHPEEVLVTLSVHFRPHLFQLILKSGDDGALLDGVEVRRYHLHGYLLAPASIDLGCVFRVLSVIHLFMLGRRVLVLSVTVFDSLCLVSWLLGPPLSWASSSPFTVPVSSSVQVLCLMVLANCSIPNRLPPLLVRGGSPL